MYIISVWTTTSGKPTEMAVTEKERPIAVFGMCGFVIHSEWKSWLLFYIVALMKAGHARQTKYLDFYPFCKQLSLTGSPVCKQV